MPNVSIDFVLHFISKLCPDCQAKWRAAIANPEGYPPPFPPTPTPFGSDLEEIMHDVSEETGIPEEVIRTRHNSAHLVEARRKVSLLARERGISYPTIGRFLRRHHSTIVHLVQSAKRSNHQ